MKRFMSILIIMLSVMCTVSAATSSGKQSKEIKIQGGYDTVSTINIVPIAAQVENFMIGMPFSLDDISIRYKAGYKGRAIATWNILTNSNFTLKIFGEQLHNYTEDKLQQYENGLGYILTFEYNLSYNSNGKPLDKRDQTFEVEIPGGMSSPRVTSSKDINILDGYAIDPGSLVGSADGTIYFKLDEQTTQERFTSGGYVNLLDGNYSAQVYVVLQIKK